MKPYFEIESIKELKEVMSEMGSDHVFRHIAFQDIDLMAVNLEGYSFADCIFMSCNILLVFKEFICFFCAFNMTISPSFKE